MLCMRMIFFFNDTATTEIYTLSLHDALPICVEPLGRRGRDRVQPLGLRDGRPERGHPVGDHLDRALRPGDPALRSEEHTSELQSRQYLVCRLLLEKKKNETSFIGSDIY